MGEDADEESCRGKREVEVDEVVETVKVGEMEVVMREAATVGVVGNKEGEAVEKAGD
jgi:hypothetical protein